VTLPGIPISILLAVVATIYPASGLVVLGPGAPVFSSLIGVAAGGLVLFLLDQATLLILKKPGMGFGDVKLLAMLGGFFGWPGVIMMLIVASLVGSVVGVIAILATRKRAEPASAGPEEGAEQPARPDANDEDEVISIEGHYLPFGPYLCLAGIVVMLAGEQIYQFYLTIANI
jgi:leader peptidase (prepilin peptidase)/N-methyltransferase